MCRRVAMHLKVEAQALTLTKTRDELFESFCLKYPSLISRAKFYEESCPYYRPHPRMHARLCARPPAHAHTRARLLMRARTHTHRSSHGRCYRGS